MVAAGDQVEAADITDLEDLTIRKPMVRLTQTAVQSIADNSGTALSFTAEEFDQYGWHDAVTNNSRITPTIAGWYRFHGTYFTSTMTSPVLLACYLRKNGATVPPGSRGPGSTATSPSVSCTALIEMNGSSDYVELVALQDSAAALNTAISAYIASTFECTFERQS